MQPEIPVQEPFKKTWSEPQIVITREDIIDYENSQKVNPIQQSDIKNTAKSQELGPESEPSKPSNSFDCRTTPQTLTDRLMDLQNSLLQSHIVRQQLHTPKKYCKNLSDSAVSNTVSRFWLDNSTTFTAKGNTFISTNWSNTTCDAIAKKKRLVKRGSSVFRRKDYGISKKHDIFRKVTKLIMVSGCPRDVVIHLLVRKQLTFINKNNDFVAQAWYSDSRFLANLHWKSVLYDSDFRMQPV